MTASEPALVTSKPSSKKILDVGCGQNKYPGAIELRPLHTYVSLANLWRAVGLELVTNLDQHWPSLRFTRKFWEFYLSSIFRGKELRFEFEVVKGFAQKVLT